MIQFRISSHFVLSGRGYWCNCWRNFVCLIFCGLKYCVTFISLLSSLFVIYISYKMNSEVVVACDWLKCVESLLGKVNTLNFTDKYRVITSLKPTPDLSISSKSKSHNRHFHRSVYKTPWIVGCSHLNKLFCWCCLFFSNDTNAWNTSGYDDLNNLSGAIKRHQNSQSHRRYVIVDMYL